MTGSTTLGIGACHFFMVLVPVHQLIEEGVTDGRGHIAAAFSALCYNIRNFSSHDDFLGFYHVDKAYGHAYDQLRLYLLLLDHFV